LKICDLTQFYSPVSGGVKRYLAEKTAYMRQHTQDRHVLIIPGAETDVRDDGPTRVYSIRSPLISRTSRYRALLNLGAVERVLEAEQPDIIESGDPYQIAWKALASGEALGIPVVGFYHSHFPEAYLRTAAKFLGETATRIAMEIARRYVRALYSKFARTLVPSAPLGALLGEWGVPNVVTIDLGVDPVIFHPANGAGEAESARAELGIPPEAKLLLYVGRLSPEKNTQTLFACFRRLTRRQPGRFHLMVVGDGQQRRMLKRLKKRTGAVTWEPYCADPKQLARYYRAADLFVHPGVQETFGLVTLESQACGTPVIGIRGSYMDRIVFSDLGYWAAENRPESLAAAISRMSRQDLRAIGLKSSAIVAERYNWKRVFDRLFGVYREVIAGFRRN
jgi:alpha-1,6-mannosyltransferase